MQKEKQCSDIVVNDITIPVEIDGGGTKVEENIVGQEVKYDNVELIQKYIKKIYNYYFLLKYKKYR